MAFYGYPCTGCGLRDCDGCGEEPEIDNETISILESRGACDESVGALTAEEWDELACACEEIVGKPWATRLAEIIEQVHQDERARAIRLREAA